MTAPRKIVLQWQPAESRPLFIVHACAIKGAMFAGTRPLRDCPRQKPEIAKAGR